MIPLSLAEIAEIVGGRLSLGGSLPSAEGLSGPVADQPVAGHPVADRIVTGNVEFDSRKLERGSLFVALPGERVDGHDYAAAAIQAGAAGVLAAREVDAPAVIVPSLEARESTQDGATSDDSTPQPNTTQLMALSGDNDGAGAAVLAALATLARAVVDRLPGLTVVGVTGSSGKTSTKDLIAQLLEPLGSTVAPPGSFNNELGHPWTVLRSSEDTRHLVLELSARGIGHIRQLCAVAPPRIGAVLNVGSAHIGEFGSQEAVAQAKGELVEALPSAEAGGVAVLNADDPLVAAMAQRTRARVVWVGQSPEADVRAEDITLDEQARPAFTLVRGPEKAPQEKARVQLPLHGEHHVANALSAAAVALEAGSSLEQVAAQLGTVQRLSERRMDVRQTRSGVTVINDAYNANPESVRAALKTLASMQRSGAQEVSSAGQVGQDSPARPPRSWAVLGVMGELGEAETSAHDEIGRLAVRLNIDRLVVVGHQARAMHHGASLEGSWDQESTLVNDVDAAVALLRAELAPGDVVLVKASKVAQLWRVAEWLLE